MSDDNATTPPGEEKMVEGTLVQGTLLSDETPVETPVETQEQPVDTQEGIITPETAPEGAYESLIPTDEEAVQEVTQEQVDLSNIVVEDFVGTFVRTNVRMWVYGASGCGKTVFASTWPRVIFLDIDKGMSSVRRPVKRIRIDDWQQLKSAFVYVAQHTDEFDTVVIDSLNEVQKLAMANTIQTFTGIRRSYEDMASVSDWGKALNDFENFVRACRALTINVVLIAQLTQREDGEDLISVPALSGKSSVETVARMMDVIGYMRKQTQGDGAVTREMIFNNPLSLGKDRSWVLPDKVELPDYDTLNSYWIKQE